jgi:hypothetical protein
MEKKDKCCTPKGQVPRYVDCKGCDKKPIEEMSKQTAVTLLFQEFRALSEVMRKAGDEKNANLIDFLCEREEVAKQMEKEQIEKAWINGMYGFQIVPFAENRFKPQAEQYYNETYGVTKN